MIGCSENRQSPPYLYIYVYILCLMIISNTNKGYSVISILQSIALTHTIFHFRAALQTSLGLLDLV